MLITNVRNIPFSDIIIKTAEAEGAELFLVGGCVRDMLLGRDIADLDMVAFGADYEKTAFKIARKIKAAAVKFKDNVRIVKDGCEFDISAPRGENIHEDLAKRDFTINNLAVGTDGQIIGDEADLRSGLIRVVHAGAFDDDPLRVVRAYRFAAQLGFEIETGTRELVKQKAEKLSEVAGERIFAELNKLCDGKYALPALKMLIADGVSEYAFGTKSKLPEVFLNNTDGAELLLKISTFLYGFEKDALKLMDGRCYPARTAKRVKEMSAGYTLLEAKADYKLFLYNHKGDAYLIADMFAAVNGGREELFGKLDDTMKLMNFDNMRLIGGAELSALGVEAGKLMGEIIKDVSFKLACSELKDKDDALLYIKDKYGVGA